MQAFEVTRIAELQEAFKRMSAARPDAILVLTDYRTLIYRALIAEFAAKNRVPTMFGSPESVEAGGLMSYGVRVSELFTRAARFVDRILNGAQPASLPVEQPTPLRVGDQSQDREDPRARVSRAFPAARDRLYRMRRRQRLFAKYASLIMALVSVVLLGSGCSKSTSPIGSATRRSPPPSYDKAEAAAASVARYIEDLARQIEWATTTAPGAAAPDLERQRIEYLKLLRLAPRSRP